MKKRILIVDDEKDILTLLYDRLIGHGYEVEVALDVDEAKIKLANAEFDLILLDVMLPHIDGYVFCKQIKDNPPTKNIPVVMLTVRAGLEDQKKGFAAGAAEYIVKPFVGEHVLEVVEKLLKKKV
jgi:DNA-binding response OmpR family regulator